MGSENPAIELFSPQDLRSAETLRQRYHELLKLYHPDRHSDRSEWANRMVRCIIAAYGTLRTRVGKPAEQTVLPDPQALVVSADDALRRAVLYGWLRRLPKPPRERAIRERVATARDALSTHPERARQAAAIDFYVALFGHFLEATDPRLLHPMPYRWGAPQTFRDLRIANAFLERGIRDYYHHRERGRLASLGGVALAYLEDAARFYAYLGARMDDGLMRQVVRARREVARAFAERILAPAELDAS